MKNIGTSAYGIKCPIIREGDDLVKIVVDSVLYSMDGELEDRDVIGITESVVARAEGNYATIDEIVEDIHKKFPVKDGIKPTLFLSAPIYSRNRFSMILKAFARATKKLILFLPEYDEVGNPRGVNPATGVDIEEYYKELCKNEGCDVVVFHGDSEDAFDGREVNGYVDCCLHGFEDVKKTLSEEHGEYTLADFCKDKCEYGLLGSNKATEEKLKLFPSKSYAEKVVKEVQTELFTKTGKNVSVMIYGDGGYHDPVTNIWEFADPVVSPAYTQDLEGTPNEIKLKAFADDKYSELDGDELANAIKTEIKAKDTNLVGKMASQGTTPRHYTDLLGSLFDLLSGSGDKGTPVGLIRGYFKNYASE